MAKYMKELEDMLCEELDEIAKKGELSAGGLDAIQKLTHSLKSIKTIEAMDDAGYSHAVYPGGHDGDYGYSRRGQRRDSMGRYSRSYSRNDGMVEELRDLMRDAPNEHVRQKIENLISEIERM